MRHRAETTLLTYIEAMDERQRVPARRVLACHEVTLAPGSGNNHQAWSGGYLDHVSEVLRIAKATYLALKAIRPVPFPLSSALVVLFVHDLEKPWKLPGMSKPARASLRRKKIAEFGFQLSKDEENAVTYVEGEGEAYSPLRRVMGPLAAFCHSCDVLSARMWFDQPEPT